MDKEYWKEYWEGDKLLTEPTAFAKECFKRKFVLPTQKLLELGHGNGRDAQFFSKAGVTVVGVDQAGAIWGNGLRLKLIRGDFTDARQMVKPGFADVFPHQTSLNPFPYKSFNCVYSRFTLHSITEPEQCAALVIAKNLLIDGGLLMIECRTIHDELYSKGDEVTSDTFFFNGHQRRFIRPGKLIEFLLVHDFSVEYCELNSGFAQHEDEDPVVLRLCVRKCIA